MPRRWSSAGVGTLHTGSEFFRTVSYEDWPPEGRSSSSVPLATCWQRGELLEFFPTNPAGSVRRAVIGTSSFWKACVCSGKARVLRSTWVSFALWAKRCRLPPSVGSVQSQPQRVLVHRQHFRHEFLGTLCVGLRRIGKNHESEEPLCRWHLPTADSQRPQVIARRPAMEPPARWSPLPSMAKR